MPVLMTPPGIISYPNLFRPRAFGNGEPKYSMTLLFDKDDPGLEPLKQAATAAADKKWPNQKPKNLRSPFLDGDEADTPEAKGKIMIRLSADEQHQPKIYDKKKVEILDASKVWAGLLGRAIVRCYAYQHESGNSGVSFGLGDVQITGDSGQRLDGGASGADVFDAIEDDDEQTNTAESLF